MLTAVQVFNNPNIRNLHCPVDYILDVLDACLLGTRKLKIDILNKEQKEGNLILRNMELIITENYNDV